MAGRRLEPLLPTRLAPRLESRQLQDTGHQLQPQSHHPLLQLVAVLLQPEESAVHAKLDLLDHPEPLEPTEIQDMTARQASLELRDRTMLEATPALSATLAARQHRQVLPVIRDLRGHQDRQVSLVLLLRATVLFLPRDHQGLQDHQDSLDSQEMLVHREDRDSCRRCPELQDHRDPKAHPDRPANQDSQAAKETLPQEAQAHRETQVHLETPAKPAHQASQANPAQPATRAAATTALLRERHQATELTNEGEAEAIKHEASTMFIHLSVAPRNVLINTVQTDHGG